MDTVELHRKLLEAQDSAANLTLLSGAVGCESITGNEANFVSYLHNKMTALSLTPAQEDFRPGRPNIWGDRVGAGDGPRLQFIGHTDTVHADGWAEHWAGTPRENPFGAAHIDGAIWGRGVADLKGGICASLAALELLDRIGIKLNGSVAYAFVGDEESGQEGTGISAGVAHWTDKVLGGEIAKPDFAIYVEPTNISVYTAQIGFFIAEVTVTGKSAYFGRPDQGVDALRAAHNIIASVWEYADRLGAKAPHELTGISSILVTSIHGGGSIAVPGECSFSVIGTLRPGDDMDLITDGFEAAVNDAVTLDGITVNIKYTAGRDHPKGGTSAEIDSDTRIIATLQQSISVAAPNRGEIGGAPYWSESPFLINRLGCPTVYCAPGDISNCHTSQEYLEVEEYLASIRAFALFMAQYCGIATPKI